MRASELFFNILCGLVSLSKVIVFCYQNGININVPHIVDYQPPSPKPYALSSIYLLKLAENEEIAYSHIKGYVETLRTRLSLAETYMKEYEQGRVKWDADPLSPMEVAENPIATIKMIRRLSQSFNSLILDMNEYPEESLLEEMNEMDSQAAFPDENAYRDVLQALLQLQYFYDLRPLDLARGVVKSKHTMIELTEVEAREITEFAVDNDYFYLAMEWIELLQQFYSSHEDTNLHGIVRRNDTELLISLVEKHDSDFEQNLVVGQAYMYGDKIRNNADTSILPVSLKTIMAEESRKTEKEILGNSAGGSFTYNHLTLCNGINLMSQQKKSQLYCWLDTKRNPYFVISPLKMEMLHDDPLLLRIYDIVTDGWIQEIKNAAIPHFARAPEPETTADTLRTAIYAWLADEEIPNTPISRLNELIFDLNVRGLNASELLQVATYALGGLVSLHVDYLGGTVLQNVNGEQEVDAIEEEDNPDLLLRGDRVSTFLVYLNDVELGGLTAFPKLKTFVKPVKGSAVFWYTSRRNGKVDSRMLHAACPVLYGHKWIATKWVHQFQNFLKRPCTTDPFL